MPTTVALNAADYGFTPGAADPTAALNTAIQAAITDGKPLFIPPGTYSVGIALIDGPVEMYGVPGQVTFQMATDAGRILRVSSAGSVTIRGISFDGLNDPLTGGNDAALIYASGSQTFLNLVDCKLFNSAEYGLSLFQVGGVIRDCEIYDCDGAMFSADSQDLVIERNIIRDCANNGIRIWQYQARYDGSIVRANHISGIDAASGGSGQFGNGINVFRAHRVIVSDNIIRDCEYSAVRANVASGIQILGNNCQDLRETAIYYEHTGGSGEAEGTVIANNVVEDCASGIVVTNFNNGGRLASCVGNVVRRCLKRNGATHGSGITAEADATISGNIVEDAENLGLDLGTASYTRNLIATGNVVQNLSASVTTLAGISVSGVSSAGRQLVDGNMVNMKASQGVDYALVARDSSGDIIMDGGSPEPVNSTNFPNVTVGTNTLFES